ncbi:two-component regulator propeller domain-containing protein [Fluviicola sp.]|uniref:two-component regulator propeller domain-containing protein n=1 Tax=Fluviicola sp. TaxID=1917219 RepID=UPI0026279FBC|nr:two-component regulator propeller domain-containing protein [Fluviicola sp.]
MKLIPIFLLFTSFVFAQTKSYYYPVEASLDDHHITAIEQDAFGRLIIGTDKGMFSFNGFQSKAIPCPKLYSKDILQLLRIKERFFGLNKTGQLFEIKQNQVVLIPVKSVKSHILRLEKGPHDLLRIICSDALYDFKLDPFSLEAKTSIPFYEKGKAELIDYCENEKGRFALLSSNELVDIDDQTSRTLPGMTGKWLMGQANSVTIFPLRPNSNISLQFVNKRFKNLNKLIGAFNHSVQKAVKIDDKIYLLSETGMIVLKYGEMRVNSVIVGLHVTAVFQDQDKNVWIGTHSKGLYCMPAGTYKMLNSTEFNSLDLFNKEIIAGSSSGELMILNKFGKKVRSVSSLNDVKRPNQAVIQVPVLLENELVKEVILLKSGNYLIVSSKGLFTIEAKSPKDLREKLKKNAARTIVLESPVKEFTPSDTNEVLFSNLEGLFTLDLETLEYKSIRYFNETIDPSQILFHDNKWYVLSSANRIFTIKNGKVAHEINFRENGSNMQVSKFKIYNNRFYLLTDKTLYKTADLNGNLERLEELSGMSDLFLRDFVVLEGKVYVATQFGLFEFKWEKIETNFPNFILGKAAGNYQKDHSTTFGSDNTEVTIPYELVELMGNHPYQLQYRLIRNGDKDQIHWSNTSLGLTKLTFEHLSSGTYNLELRLFDPGTGRFSRLSTTDFKIQASWYEDTLVWFVAGILVGFFGLLYLKRRKRLKKLELKG